MARNIRHIKFVQSSVCKVYGKFSDELADLKAMKSSYLDRQNSCFSKTETENPMNKE